MKIIHEGRITRNPAVMVGKPCIKGTRITVEFILEKLIQGATVESLLYDYDHLTKEDIYACIDYARAIMVHEEVYELTA
jgi:uncharacterized protein (DUF433 family)